MHQWKLNCDVHSLLSHLHTWVLGRDMSMFIHVGFGFTHVWGLGTWDMSTFTRVGLGRGMGHEHVYTRESLGKGMSKQRCSCSRLERMKHMHFFQLVYCTSCTVIRGSPFTYDLERPISTFLCIYNFHKF